MKSLRLMILIGLIAFSGCTTTKIRTVYVPVKLFENCIFEKFTQEEKATIADAVGEKIFRNQENCRIIKRANDKLIKKHNKLLNDK